MKTTKLQEIEKEINENIETVNSLSLELPLTTAQRQKVVNLLIEKNMDLVKKREVLKQ